MSSVQFWAVQVHFSALAEVLRLHQNMHDGRTNGVLVKSYGDCNFGQTFWVNLCLHLWLYLYKYLPLHLPKWTFVLFPISFWSPSYPHSPISFQHLISVSGDESGEDKVNTPAYKYTIGVGFVVEDQQEFRTSFINSKSFATLVRRIFHHADLTMNQCLSLITNFLLVVLLQS